MEEESKKEANRDDSESQESTSEEGEDEKESDSSCSLDASDLYNPARPNVYSPSQPSVHAAVQARAPPGVTFTQHGQSEVITSSGGRRYVAQFFEQASGTSERTDEVLPTANTPDDSHMAKALCINLLTELVKGSYQLLKTSTPSDDEPSSKALQNQIADSYERMQRRIDVAMNCSDSSSSSEEQDESPVPIASHSHPFAAPSGESKQLNAKENADFKKATHSWQIKKSQGCQESGDPGTSTREAESHTRERKRTMEGSGSDGETLCPETDTAVVKKRKFAESKSCSESSGINSDNQRDLTLKDIRQECNDYQTCMVSSSVNKNLSQKHMHCQSPQIENSQNKVTVEEACRDFSSSETDADQSTESAMALERTAHEAEESRQSDPDAANVTSESIEEEVELTYLEKWHKHHMAKAIVDNAINKTLDEMALGPPDRTYFSSQRQRIEDAGVSQAISARGLRRTSAVGQSTDNSQLQPFISQLTQASEDMFVETLADGVGTRFSTSFNVPPDSQRQQPPLRSAAAFFTRPSLSERVQSYTLTEERGGPEQSSQNQCNSKTQKASESHEESDDKVDSMSSGKTESSQDARAKEHFSSSHSCNAPTSSTSQTKEQSSTESINVQISCTSESAELKSSNSPDSTVLAQALEAVIYDKGLQF